LNAISKCNQRIFEMVQEFLIKFKNKIAVAFDFLVAMEKKSAK
jgi:hypothetical protein